MDYLEYRYLWPPRPEDAISPAMLDWYEDRDWVAQVKKNGTNCPVFTTDTGVLFKTRHNDNHKQWMPTAGIIEFFEQFPAWTVFSTELMHSKTTHIKDTLYIHDIVAYDGEQLVDTTFTERQKLLHEIMGVDEVTTYSHQSITDNIWLASTIHKGFANAFEAASAFTEDEGLVLKNPDAMLKPCSHAKSNARWMVKCRKPHKNYTF